MAEQHEQLDRLVRDHGRAVVAYAASRLGDTHRAHDVHQETFLRAMRYLDRNPPEPGREYNYRAWLKKIASRVIADDARKRSGMLVRSKETVSTELDDEIRLELEDEDAPDPSDGREEDPELLALRDCVAGLTGRARALVEETHLRGRKIVDLNKELNKKPKALRVALHRALQKLKDCILERVSQAAEASS